MRNYRKVMVATMLALAAASAQGAPASPTELAMVYQQVVDRRLQVPSDEVQRYAALADRALGRAGVVLAGAQYIALVDRDPEVQAFLLLWRSATGTWQLVGASPVSTGAPGSFDHFETPVGVFDHSTRNLDFRAEGTLDSNGIRGYGAKGMRVYDFGWQRAPKGWGNGEVIDMRLQMHATDADVLEPRLGSAQSRGCVRIPATLNKLLDRYGILEAEYEELAREGLRYWVLREDREPVANAGRYLVIVDSERTRRPDWSPALPTQRARIGSQPATPPPPIPPQPPRQVPVPIH